MADYYTNYYIHQSGGGITGGRNTNNSPYLEIQLPRVYQRGRGVGAIFSTLWRFLKPLLKAGASFVGHEAIHTGSDILKGIANQKPIKKVLADRSIQVVDKIRDKAASKINSMAGAGAKMVSRKRKKPINSKAVKKFHQFAAIRRVKKKKNNNKLQKTVKTRILDIFSNKN